ncbi:hypothetical protein TNCV_884921 [Trichonephila clavipes]|nr:hypothetical protein TNCV_884921 [Trichonephila clavipes]
MRKKKKQKSELKHSNKHTLQRNVRTKGKADEKTENTLTKQRPNSEVASTSKDSAVRCPACEEEYCDPSTEEWI